VETRHFINILSFFVPMKKRGTLVLKPIVELTIAAFVVVSFLGIAKVFGTGEAYLQARYARDGALLTDALVSIPGAGWVSYPTDLSAYTVKLENGRFRVIGDAETSYAFASADDVNPRELSKPKFTYFFHDGKTLSIADERPALSAFRCDQLELGDVVLKARLDETSSDIAPLLGVRCSSDFLCATGEGVDPNVFVKIVTVKEPGMTSRFFYDSPHIAESRTLACMLSRDFSLAHADVPVWMLPSDDIELRRNRDVITLLVETDRDNLVDVGRLLRKSLQLEGGG
jgi:hypothetical protein